MNRSKIILKFIFTIVFFSITSCGLKVVDNHGQIYEKNINFDDIIIGKTTKKEINDKLGSPSTTSNFDNEQSWYYVSSEFKKFVFLDGANTNQKILLLTFNKEIVKDKELLLKEDINQIAHEETITDSRGKKISWLKEFFTNLNPDPYGQKK